MVRYRSQPSSLLALLAILVQVLLPPGFMPSGMVPGGAVDADGLPAWALTLCGGGVRPQEPGAPDERHPDGSASQAHTVCPFAIPVPGPAPAPAASVASPPARLVATVTWSSKDPRDGGTPARHRWPPGRAPPSLG